MYFTDPKELARLRGVGLMRYLEEDGDAEETMEKEETEANINLEGKTTK